MTSRRIRRYQSEVRKKEGDEEENYSLASRANRAMKIYFGTRLCRYKLLPRSSIVVSLLLKKKVLKTSLLLPHDGSHEGTFVRKCSAEDKKGKKTFEKERRRHKV